MTRISVRIKMLSKQEISRVLFSA